MSRQEDDGAVMAESLTHPEAFGALVDRHHATVHRYVARRLGADRSDDVVAETFVVAFSKRDRYDGRPNAVPWLLGITTRLIGRLRRDEVRALRAYSRSGVDPFDSAESADVDARLDAQALAPQLAGALAAMRPNHRHALLLCALGGLSADEVARALDVSPATVRSWLFRARATAHRHLPATAAPVALQLPTEDV